MACTIPKATNGTSARIPESRGPMPPPEQSLYEYAGGAPAMLAVAAAFHARCLADPLLEHPFSKPDQHPEHVQRLAAYWTQMLGGASAYTDLGVDQSYLMRIHLGEGGASAPYRHAFVACFDAAVDDAGLPADPDFRLALHDSQVWAAENLMPDHDDPAQVPDGLAVPVWSWGGLRDR